METKKVRIINATCLRSGINGNYFKETAPWYENKIGNIYEVLQIVQDYAGNECYNVVRDGHLSGLYIKVEDCKDVK